MLEFCVDARGANLKQLLKRGPLAVERTIERVNSKSGGDDYKVVRILLTEGDEMLAVRSDALWQVVDRTPQDVSVSRTPVLGQVVRVDLADGSMGVDLARESREVLGVAALWFAVAVLAVVRGRWRSRAPSHRSGATR